MRLTSDLIAEAFRFNNPAGEYTLSLRSLHISSIESLDTTGDIFEAIDLTDNDIRILDNIPKVIKLKTLLLAKNRIQLIEPEVGSNLPNLTNLSLIGNNLKTLKSLEPLQSFKSLENLYLLENPVTKIANYRLWCIALLPNLKILDFQKIKDVERVKAKELLDKGSYDKVSEKSMVKEQYDNKEIKLTLTKLQKAKLEEDIKNAETLEETERIAEILKRGYL